LTPRRPFPCLSVVIPCYNEHETIGEVLDRVLAAPWTAEVIVVDDGSRDGSPDVVARVEDERVRLLRQPRNLGKGAALRRGFLAATQPYVVVQDADLEYDPADYDHLLAPMIDGHADVVYGSRFHTDTPHRVLYYWHSVANKLLTTLSNMTTNLNLTDVETCYKAFRREVIQTIEIEEDRFGFEPEVTAKVAAGKWRVFEVGISYRGRTYEEGKKIGWKDGLWALLCVLRYSIPFQWQHHKHRREIQAAEFSFADAELAASLDSLDDADNYANWIVELMSPYLGGQICEVGAGHGTFTGRLASFGKLVACDPSPRCIERLRAQYGGDAGIEIVEGEFSEAAADRTFDSIVAINVLEHIADDDAELSTFRRHLSPGGHVIVFAPALARLYSDFDRRIGHHRRYRRGSLAAAVYRSGLEVVETRYVNAVGVAAWWLFAKKLRRVPTRTWSVRLYDRKIVPWLRRFERGRNLPAGQSVLCVARRPPDREDLSGTAGTAVRRGNARGALS
jgi:glycosyltransferase involved in cell wall biosynthesis